MGDFDKALDYLERAYEERHGDILFMKVNPVFKEIWGMERFKGILRKAGLE